MTTYAGLSWVFNSSKTCHQQVEVVHHIETAFVLSGRPCRCRARRPSECDWSAANEASLLHLSHFLSIGTIRQGPMGQCTVI